MSQERALAARRVALAGRSIFLDAAASYGGGESGRRIGLPLHELGGLPAGHVLATKADRNLQTGDFSGDQVRRSVERSLPSLGLQRLQMVFAHDPERTEFSLGGSRIT